MIRSYGFNSCFYVQDCQTGESQVKVKPTDIFHVHTFRCKHAEEVPDEAYVKKTIELGATGIWFSDHSPFPGDPFRNRMKLAELEEYLDTLSGLKEKYKNQILIHIGLEIEYFPSFRGFYDELKSDARLEFLLLGQHIYETAPGQYNFTMSPEEKNRLEWSGCGHSMLEGIITGLFDIVAHPDRIFRRCKKEWTPDMEQFSRTIIQKAQEQGMALEKNYSSVQRKYHYRQQFWELVPPEVPIVFGTDAHSLKELEEARAWILAENK